MISEIKLDSLQLCNGTYVDESLRSLVTDILFSVKLRDSPEENVYLYLLCEHFSDPKPLSGWKMLKYVYRIIDGLIEQQKTNILPVVIPLMIYNGAVIYPYPTEFCKLFGENQALAQEYVLRQH